MNNTQITSFPIAGLLGIAFIILKLTGAITWSWWWVLAPFWVLPALFLTILIGALLVTGAATLLSFRKKK